MKIHDKKDKNGKLELREIVDEPPSDKKIFFIRRTQNGEFDLSIGTHEDSKKITLKENQVRELLGHIQDFLNED